jgi:hypothetical protein
MAEFNRSTRRKRRATQPLDAPYLSGFVAFVTFCKMSNCEILRLSAILILLAANHICSAADSGTTNHWSFLPLRRPPVPEFCGTNAAACNPIDGFIFGSLAENQLSHVPEADRRTLARRLYFDLVGMPPTPEDILTFLHDRRPDAYERLVDRLLASPRFGERWARHWLDVVRFAETHGFEMNQPRPNAWPYRDYVIAAFNEDKPYNQFVLEQIAGDVLGADQATGFLVAGTWDQVKSPDEVLTKNQRADELHDIVSTTGSAFLGLTIGCARCHDHKFDPIPQHDYYAIKAVFEGVYHGERERYVPDSAARLRAAEAAQAQLAELEAQLTEFEPLAQSSLSIDTTRLRAPVHPRLNVDRFAPVAAKRLRFTIQATTDAEPCLDELEVYTALPETVAASRAARLQDLAREQFTRGSTQNVALASLGSRPSASGTYSSSQFHKLEHLNDGRFGNGRSWISNEKGKGWVELEFPETVTVHRVVWGRDREEKFKDRLATDYRIEVATGAGEFKLVASSADRRPFTAGAAFTPDFATNGLSEQALARLVSLVHRQKTLEDKLKELRSKPMVYAGEFKKPEPTRRFNRGDPMQPREEIMPGMLTRITLQPGRNADGRRRRDESRFVSSHDLNNSAATTEQERRVALAQWIASPDNPLTARVIVNRLWQYHFSEGLVNTASDFGRNGAKPTHPALLDWLATELISHGWSLKHIHRLIVTSATYRQSSNQELVGTRSPASVAALLRRTGVPEPLRRTGTASHSFSERPVRIDAANRLLWHFPVRRLEAESLRDSILADAGRLDLRMGGPGWSSFEPNDNYVRVYTPKREFGPEDFRRMIYATSVRQRPDGVFGAFDCPDGAQIAPKRTHSTTPLQALNLLNSGFIMQAAAFFADRLEREAGTSTEAQVKRAFLLAFQREASAEEIIASVRLVREQGLKIFCRALFNANEFVYVY